MVYGRIRRESLEIRKSKAPFKDRLLLSEMGCHKQEGEAVMEAWAPRLPVGPMGGLLFSALWP